MDEELNEEQEDRGRSRRIVESHSYHQEGLMTLGTKILLIVALALVTGVGILAWVLGPTLKPVVAHVSVALGAYGWLWLDLLIVLAIGSVIGLLRRLGVVKLLEDVVGIALRIHEHLVSVRQLKADKIGNYPLPLDAQGYPILVPPGNSPHPAPAPIVQGSIAARKAARAATSVVEEGAQSQQTPAPILSPSPVYPQLSAPASFSRKPLEDIPMKLQPVSGIASVWGDVADSRTFARKTVPGFYHLIEELAMFQPAMDRIFMGRTANGPVLLSLEHMPHLVFAGPTGVGKSKIVRMLFAQLIAINVQCYMCDSHYIPYSQDEGLDWTPIEARLMHPPIRDYATSADFLEWLAREELQTRKDRAFYSKPVGMPIMAGIEELAGIIDANPEAAKSIGILLRQGRKYGICLAIAAQDLLAKSIGLDSGMIENIQTGYYGGGDLRTAKIALDLQNGEHINEEGLGRGQVYLKTIHQQATLTRIPWPDNDAVQALCSQSQLPVHELVREPLPEMEETQAVYHPHQGQEGAAPSNIRPLVQPARRGAQEKPIDPAHLEFVRTGGGFDLGNKRLAVVLGITEHQAGKIKNVVRRERGIAEVQEEQAAEEMSVGE